MKIVSFQAENIKRLIAVQIRPDGNLVEITGKNGQGKTSILDAIYFTLAGNKVIQSKPIRGGAKKGYCALDLGDYIVKRTFNATDDGDYTTSLTVTNKDGFKAGSPQDLLNGFLGNLTFDPLAFSRMKAREQVVALRGLVPSHDFVASDKANKADFDDRTEVNRRAKALRQQADGIVLSGELPAERIDEAALVSELEKAGETNTDIERQRSRRDAASREIDEMRALAKRTAEDAEELRKQAAALDRQAEEYERVATDKAARLADAPALPDPIDTAEVRRQIDEARETNRQIDARDRRSALETEAKELEGRSDALTQAIDDRKAVAEKAVREAELPVSGLEITEDAILLNGQPFDQASDAEQLRVSIAVASAMNPKLKVVRVRDGSLLDPESMAALAAYAEENDLQVWIETVASARETAIVIEDGRVAGAAAEVAA